MSTTLTDIARDGLAMAYKRAVTPKAWNHDEEAESSQTQLPQASERHQYCTLEDGTALPLSIEPSDPAEPSEGGFTPGEGETAWSSFLAGVDTEFEHSLDYDTCFGVVIVDVSLPTTDHQDITGVPVTIRPNGGVLSLYFEESGQFAAIIDSRALRKVLSHYAPRLVATLSLKQSHNSKPGKKSKRPGTSDPKWRVENATVRITVYGNMRHKDDIADLFSGEGLFFQQPTVEEYDSSVPYFNPHLLLRPGAEMPKIEDLSISDPRSAASRPALLDEVNQGKIWRIFDLANGDGASVSVAASGRLKSPLRHHQLQALNMMTERERGIIEDAKFPSLWQATSSPHNPKYRHIITGSCEKKPRFIRGGVLADEMGLGKTLTTLALICWYLDVRDAVRCADDRPGESSTTLIVVPKSIIIGWESQIVRHINSDTIAAITYHGPSRRRLVPDFSRHDIVLTTYETLREDYLAPRKSGAQTLYSHHWHRVVLDEAHRIRTRGSELHRAALAISKLAHCHWCLTGTPIHNSLDDYGALLAFIQAPKISEKRDFVRLIVKPMEDENRRGLSRLQDLVNATCLRRTISSLGTAALQLAPLDEKIEWLDLGRDNELYTFFKRKAASVASGFGKQRAGNTGKDKGGENILSLLNFLRQICDYGERMLPVKALESWREGGMNEDGAISTCPDSDQTGENQGITAGSSRSAKAEAVIRNILGQQSATGASLPQKSVVFSCWTRMLDLIQNDLESVGLGVQRIDGSASLPQRRVAIEQFMLDPRCVVMLASIGSAGEGIDLISACHVHILEPQWNPMAESQAIGRVYRMGQKQRVSVTRYIVNGTIETYVQWIKKDKLRLISQSLGSRTISQEEVDQKRWKELNKILF
ncbi:uncharacterized protein DNG_09606 [Cephalotrichum gorgonifer]|uniref:SNF2_N domain-containing protein/Helicase_C domain-containing protein n=1 Tax=Cephalotrichum gorgonifer TaxID=2041049 RepID=A0AAE8N8F5_9PEZI|nr:uncharacterized protein DNG_09606 [Cephalotrichum gorgonifer]